jgi:hypothetical protein
MNQIEKSALKGNLTLPLFILELEGKRKLAAQNTGRIKSISFSKLSPETNFITYIGQVKGDSEQKHKGRVLNRYSTTARPRRARRKASLD